MINKWIITAVSIAGLSMAATLCAESVKIGTVELKTGDTWEYGVGHSQYKIGSPVFMETGIFQYTIEQISIQNDTITLDCVYRDSVRFQKLSPFYDPPEDKTEKRDYKVQYVIINGVCANSFGGAGHSISYIPSDPPFLQPAPREDVWGDDYRSYNGELLECIISGYPPYGSSETWVESLGSVDDGEWSDATSHNPESSGWSLRTRNGNPFSIDNMKPTISADSLKCKSVELKKGDMWEYSLEYRDMSPVYSGTFRYSIKHISTRNDSTFLHCTYRDSLHHLSPTYEKEKIDTFLMTESDILYIIAHGQVSTSPAYSFTPSYEKVPVVPPFLSEITDPAATHDLVRYEGQRLEHVFYPYGSAWLESLGMIRYYQNFKSDDNTHGGNDETKPWDLTWNLAAHNGISFSLQDLTTAIRAPRAAAQAKVMGIPSIGSTLQLERYLAGLQNGQRIRIFGINGRCMFQAIAPCFGRLPIFTEGSYVLSVEGMKKETRQIILNGR
jgi:hypothetical protein